MRKTVIRNRRLMYMEQATVGATDGTPALHQDQFVSYFSDEAMRRRDPVAFEQYIGQYIPLNERAKPFDKNVGLVERIFSNLDDCDYYASIAAHKDGTGRIVAGTGHEYDHEQHQIMSQEVEFDSDDEDNPPENPITLKTSKHANTSENQISHKIITAEATGDCDSEPPTDNNITLEERNALRAELVRIMKERFLSGLDTEFDYDTVDNNPIYDNSKVLDQDVCVG